MAGVGSGHGVGAIPTLLPTSKSIGSALLLILLTLMHGSLHVGIKREGIKVVLMPLEKLSNCV